MKFKDNCLLFSVLACSFFSLNTFSNTLTLRLESPQPELDLGRVYALDEIAERTGVSPARGGSIPDAFVITNNSYFSYNPPMKKVDYSFADKSALKEYFDEEIAIPLAKMVADVRKEIESTKVSKLSWQTVERLEVKADPMIVNMGVRNNKIEVNISGLTLDTKIRASISNDLLKVLCGLSVSFSINASISASGYYDIGSGLINLERVVVDRDTNTSCSGAFGMVLDSIFDFAFDRVVKDQISSLAREVLNKYTDKPAGKGLDDIVHQELLWGESILGHHILEEAYGAINRYVGGFNIDFKIGVGYPSHNNDLLGFAIYQDFASIKLNSKRVGWAQRTYANISCPSWGTELKVYRSEAVVVGTRRSVRGNTTSIYGLKFNEVAVSGLTYESLLGSRGRGTGTEEPQAVMAACKSRNGLWGRLNGAVFIP